MITGYCSDYFLLDRAYDADRLIHLAESQGSKIVIPSKSTRIDQRSNMIGIFIKNDIWLNVFAKLKVFRRVSTRYEKLAKIYRAAVLIASCMVWLLII
jgi:transposase